MKMIITARDRKTGERHIISLVIHSDKRLHEQAVSVLKMSPDLKMIKVTVIR